MQKTTSTLVQDTQTTTTFILSSSSPCLALPFPSPVSPSPSPPPAPPWLPSSSPGCVCAAARPVAAGAVIISCQGARYIRLYYLAVNHGTLSRWYLKTPCAQKYIQYRPSWYSIYFRKEVFINKYFWVFWHLRCNRTIIVLYQGKNIRWELLATSIGIVLSVFQTETDKLTDMGGILQWPILNVFLSAGRFEIPST